MIAFTIAAVAAGGVARSETSQGTAPALAFADERADERAEELPPQGSSDRAVDVSTEDEEEPGASEPAAEAESEPAVEPATRAARKILALKDKIYANLTLTRYQHRTYVRRREGVYLWDCSAMVAWFLKRTAPVAHAAIDRPRPVARDYYRKIKRASTKRARDGWRRLPHIEDARPGDLFAWIRPPNFPSRNTGHVGFVLEPAKRYPAIPDAYTVRILDATSLPHGDDTREFDEGGGIGEGTLLFLTDGEGRGTAYGWFGADSTGVIATDIVFGRVNR